MPDALPPEPEVIEGPVSIVRLHGEACLFCGAVDKTLRATGHVVVRGSARVWQIVTCGCGVNGEHTDCTPRRPLATAPGRGPRSNP
jgi:hypothetical protein